MLIENAKKEDKDFIIFANKEINIASGLKETFINENIDKDILCDNPKCECLIVRDNNEQVAMCLYSKIYWANQGQGVYLSQVYVKPEYRKQGIFKMIINNILDNDSSIKFITCLVGNENEDMQASMNKTGWKTADLKSYYFKR